jgi:hypothetical protein
LFPNGENGWDQNLKRKNPDDDQNSNANQEEQEMLEEEDRIAKLNTGENKIEIYPEPGVEEEADIDQNVPVRIYDVNRRGPRSRVTRCEFSVVNYQCVKKFSIHLYMGDN